MTTRPSSSSTRITPGCSCNPFPDPSPGRFRQQPERENAEGGNDPSETVIQRPTPNKKGRRLIQPSPPSFSRHPLPDLNRRCRRGRPVSEPPPLPETAPCKGFRASIRAGFSRCCAFSRFLFSSRFCARTFRRLTPCGAEYDLPSKGFHAFPLLTEKGRSRWALAFGTLARRGEANQGIPARAFPSLSSIAHRKPQAGSQSPGRKNPRGSPRSGSTKPPGRMILLRAELSRAQVPALLLRVAGPRHDRSPIVSIQHPIDGGLGHLVPHPGFKGTMDVVHPKLASLREAFHKFRKKLPLLVESHIAVAAASPVAIPGLFGRAELLSQSYDGHTGPADELSGNFVGYVEKAGYQYRLGHSELIRRFGLLRCLHRRLKHLIGHFSFS